MRKLSILLVACLFAPFTSFGVGAPSFEDGKDESIVSLTAPDYEATVNLEVPSDYYVTNATMKDTGMAVEGNASAYPENVTMWLDDTIIWGFQKPGFGPLGMQDRFSTGQKQLRFEFSATGGSQNAYIRLLKDAVVQSASMDLTGFPPATTQELMSFLGEEADDNFGGITSAKDVNGDGNPDFMIGANQYTKAANGKVYLYFGGDDFDTDADVILSGEAAYDGFGTSLACGDMNGDGYADILVGAPFHDDLQDRDGRAYLFLGGKNMDNSADVIFSGKGNDFDRFGGSVACAGDVNNDGYDDFFITAYIGYTYLYFGSSTPDNVPDFEFNSGGRGIGDVNNDGYDDVIIGNKIFFGGPNWDNTSDVDLVTPSCSEICWEPSLGRDVNGDGYDDVIIGNWTNSVTASRSGAIYIYLGGNPMDGIADIICYGPPVIDYGLGLTAVIAGDLDNDGYNDVLTGGGYGQGADYRGNVDLFLGGPHMDNRSDLNLTGTGSSEKFAGVAGIGDINHDGFNEFAVGATGNDENGTNAGKVYIYNLNKTNVTGILGPGISIGSKTIWTKSGYFNGTERSGDFAQAINDCLTNASVSNFDEFGNAYIDLQIKVTAKDKGYFNISNLKLVYQYKANISDFSSALNKYLNAHKGEKDGDGNVQVPIKILSHTAGRVKLSDLALTRDLPPKQVEDIKSMEIHEDMANYNLADLYQFFQDDVDPDNNLSFSVASSTNSSFVTVGIRNNRYLAANAMTGDANDNWTGTVEVVVACSDRWGQRTESNQFTIIVKNVNDPPIITSTPNLNAEPGVPYSYNVTVVDGDRDIFRYSLSKAPENMTIDPSNGIIEWLPRARGTYEVILVVNDGNATAEQEFYLTVPNRPPIITSSPPLKAYLGIPYTYNITAEDPNLDALSFLLLDAPNGMDLEHSSNALIWTPDTPGKFDVSIKAWDGKIGAFQNFTLEVVQGNRAPEFKSKPVTVATVDVPYVYNASATDPDNDVLEFSIESGPDGLTVDTAKGQVSWTPKSIGNFTVVLKVSDGRGSEAKQEFIIKVLPAARPQVVLVAPEPGKTLKGIVTFSGTVTKGTREVVQAQMRVDGGEWNDLAGTYSWTYNINTKSLKNGVHTFEFRAYDGTDYSDIVKLDYKVDNTVGGGKGFIPMVNGLMMLALAFAVLALSGMKRNRRFGGSLRPDS